MAPGSGRGPVRRRRSIHDDAAAAARWNVLLDRLHHAPEARLYRASVRRRGQSRPVAGWAVVDSSGAIRAAACDEDLAAWCAALESAGLRVAARR